MLDRSTSHPASMFRVPRTSSRAETFVDLVTIELSGHNGCGAIKGAIDKVKLGNLTAMLQNIEPAIKSLGKLQGERDSHNYELVQQVAIANAKLAAQNIQKRSKVMSDLIKAGQLKVFAAMHDVATGEVTWLS